MRLFRLVMAMLAVGTAVLTLACGGGDEVTSSPTPTASPAPSPAPTAAPVTSLRDVDFSTPAIVGPLVDRAGGGGISAERVLYGQLIDDGPEEAIVIVDSGGSAGEVGAGVYRLVEGQPVLQRFFSYNGRIEVRRELIVTREGVYASTDAECCPSHLREITYQWDGSRFAVTTDQVVPNPSR